MRKMTVVEWHRKVSACPMLSTLINNGTIRIHGQEYIGTAADGIEVTLGNIGREDDLESYLSSHPNPVDW